MTLKNSISSEDQLLTALTGHIQITFRGTLLPFCLCDKNEYRHLKRQNDFKNIMCHSFL